MIVKNKEEAIKIFSNYFHTYEEYLKRKKGKRLAEIKRFAQNLPYYLEKALEEEINKTNQLLAVVILLSRDESHYYFYHLEKPISFTDMRRLAESVETMIDVAAYLARHPFIVKKPHS